MLGTFCDRQKDCVGSNLCCVREPAINPVISICKPALDEHQTCGPYNQFRTVYIGGTVQPVCGPCKQGLVCKQVGYVKETASFIIHKIHFVTLLTACVLWRIADTSFSEKDRVSYDFL